MRSRHRVYIVDDDDDDADANEDAASLHVCHHNADTITTANNADAPEVPRSSPP